MAKNTHCFKLGEALANIEILIFAPLAFNISKWGRTGKKPSIAVIGSLTDSQ